MRVRRGPPRIHPWLVLLAVVVVSWADACGGSGAEPTPVPSLASSPESAIAFDAFRAAWSDGTTSVAELRKRLESFLLRFPRDGLTSEARVYLALVAMLQDDFVTADAQLLATSHLPPGATRDLRTVARARRSRLNNQAEVALSLLTPLVGKNVDPLTRALFEEELTLTALATHLDYEAISYMDAWIRASPPEERHRTIASVKALVQRLSKDVLVRELQAMRTNRANLGYGAEIERILAARLAQLATESHDAELARLLLDPDAGAILLGGENGTALTELATSRRGLNMVAGRTVGLLLPTRSAGLRDEAADVLRGVMWAFGLPRGLREGAAPASAVLARAAARAPCASAVASHDAVRLEDPRPEDGLRLTTREDSGGEDDTEASLDELAGEGAAIVIAGLDAPTAARALHWGEAHGVPVVVLASLAGGEGAGAFGFSLGEARQPVIEALTASAPSLASMPVVPVIDSGELATYAGGGGHLGALTLAPPVSCDLPPTRAGEPRFPLAEWAAARAGAWIVSGSPSCGTDVVDELSVRRLRGVVGLTLEAAGFPSHGAALRVVTASAGYVPPEGLDGSDELRRFSASLGGLGWWTALGRDAATLTRVAVESLPSDTAAEPATVRERRIRARDLLATAQAPLWTSEATSLGPSHTLSRTVCAVEVPAK